MLTGVAHPIAGSATQVELDGGGVVTALDRATGPVAVSVYPWEIALAPEHAADPGSTRNHLAVEVVSITAVGNRVRVGLAAPQPLTAELSTPPCASSSWRRAPRVASWKAAATRLLPLGERHVWYVTAMTRVAVVGHVEWMEFARVPALPAPGDIVHATEVWEEAAAAARWRPSSSPSSAAARTSSPRSATTSGAPLRGAAGAHGVRVHAAPRTCRSGAASRTSTATASARSP